MEGIEGALSEDEDASTLMEGEKEGCLFPDGVDSGDEIPPEDEEVAEGIS